MQTKMRSLKVSVTLLLFLFGTLTLTQCDKSDPVRILPEDVAGTYSFTNFIFIPDATALEPADMLDTLVAANTNLVLLDGGQFTLSYRFVNGSQSLISGDFTARAEEIKLTAAPGSETRLTSLLLHSPLELQLDLERGILESTTSKTVDLSAFSGRYEGVPPVSGRLILELILTD